MEEYPKSFWAERERVDSSSQWVTHLDDLPAFKLAAEIIHACSLRGLPPPIADEMELWEMAAYLGLHRIETLEERENREIVETKKEYWEETETQRKAKLADYSARRKARAKARRQQKAS